MLDSPLSENDLLDRFDKYGRIPRFIFTDAQVDENEELNQAINSFDALKVLSYVKGKTVREKDYSHVVFCMVPSEDFRTIVHLDLLSKYVAEKIVDKVTNANINEPSAFYIANSDDDSGSSFAVQGRIYEMLCHRMIKGDRSTPFKCLLGCNF